MNEFVSVESLWQASGAAMRGGRWPDVARDCTLILESRPAHVGAMLRLSQAWLRGGRYSDARGLVLAAIDPARKSAAESIAVSKALRYFEEHQAVVSLLRDALPAAASLPLPQALEACGLAQAVGAFELASEYLESCSGASRRDPRWLYQSGVLATFRGEFDRAERSLEACIAAGGAHPQAHWMLARLERIDPKSHHVVRLRAALQACAPSSEGATYLALALHQELHVLKRYDEAWAALALTFAPKPWLPGYDAAATHARFDALRSWKPPASDNAVQGQFKPVFIVGMHRSGTSLLERMLAGHSQIADAGESYAFPAQLRLAANVDTAEAVNAEIVGRSVAFDYGLIGSGYLQGSAWRLGQKGLLTEKLPHNFMNVGFAAASLRDARFINVVRDPVDTCFSNLRTFFRQIGSYSYDLVQIADFYAGYRSLMDHWIDMFPERVLSLDYASLVAGPELEIRRVLEFCGLDFEPSVLDVGRSGGVIATASSAQARGTIDANRASAAEPYLRQLAPMINRLREHRCI